MHLETHRLRHTTVRLIELSIWLGYSFITTVPAVAVVSLTGLPRIEWCGAFSLSEIYRLRTGDEDRRAGAKLTACGGDTLH